MPSRLAAIGCRHIGRTLRSGLHISRTPSTDLLLWQAELPMSPAVAHAAGMTTSQQYDVLVVGGGAAGLSAALSLGRVRRSVLVVDAGEPRNAPAEHMHAFLSRDGLPPRELLEIGRREVKGYG